MALSLDGTTGISASGNITGGNVIASGSLIVTNFTPASVSTAGNVTGGNLLTGGLISSTGNITSAANVAGGNLLATTTVSAASHIGSIVSVTANITGGNILTGGLISATGNITSAANVAGGNILVTTTVSAASYIGTTVSVSGTVTGGTLVSTGTISAAGNIVSTAANATANIGSATTYFNTVHAKATSAQYADVAEKYIADVNYAPGTVVEFGGTHEVTVTRTGHSERIAGVVSTNPAYVMNAGANGDAVVEVALLGRVPCSVVGTIAKGDRLVSSQQPGVAQKLNPNFYQPGCIIGKALENYDSDQVGVIEVVVGRI